MVSAEAMADAWESLYTSCGGELLYDASVCDVILEDQKIKYVIANTIEGLVAYWWKTVRRCQW